jgi:hypothetical protein
VSGQAFFQVDKSQLHIEIFNRQRMGLNKVTPWLNLITHKRGKDLIRTHGIFYADL